jgi:hypothetical protein
MHNIKQCALRITRLHGGGVITCEVVEEYLSKGELPSDDELVTWISDDEHEKFETMYPHLKELRELYF